MDDSDNKGVIGSGSQATAELLLANNADINDLAKLIRTSKDVRVPRAALGVLSDQTLLREFAGTLPAAALRVIAVQRITDEAFLLARSRDDSSAAVRSAAVKAMKSPGTLLIVATDSYYGDLRVLAASYPTFDSTARARIAAGDRVRADQIRHIAVESDRQILADTALNGKFDSVCLAAVRQLSDQALLAKVSMKTTDRVVAKAALVRLTEQAALDNVATSADDPAVRIAAAVARNMTNWQEVFAKAAHVGDSKSLGDALAAVSLSTAPGGIKDLVTETCLRLIRRGDESHIPELADLLDAYGDVALCEDYLNCGQPDLHNAGAHWAIKQGYRIVQGHGSSRAT